MDFLFLGPKNPPKWLLAVLSHRRSQNSETAGRLNLSWLHFPNECHQPFSHQLRCLTKLRQLYAAGNIWCCHQQIACDSITWIKRHAPIPESGILNRILQFPGPTCCGSQAEHNWDKKTTHIDKSQGILFFKGGILKHFDFRQGESQNMLF